MEQFAKVFKALGQETRLRILFLLRDQELCVCELEAILGLSQSAVSQHLRILREANLVTERRLGQWVLYYLHHTSLPKQFDDYLQMMQPASGTPPAFAQEGEKLLELEHNPIIHHSARQSCVRACHQQKLKE